jgi:adenylate cyclase
MIRAVQQLSNDDHLSVDQRNTGSIEGASDVTLADDIRRQVDRILASPEFAVPDRARRVLSYLVNETLAGRADRIKAYSIAIEVFGRDETFDAQNDPVVRIEAGRIRRALERYYLVAGQTDPVVVSIPKGGYVPKFEWQDLESFSASTPESGAPSPIAVDRTWRSYGAELFGISLLGAAIFIVLFATSRPPGTVTKSFVPNVVVAAFSNSGEDGSSRDFAFGLRAEIVNQLARFKDIIVTAERSVAYAPEPGRGDPGGPADRYELTGSVRSSSDRIRVTVQLVEHDSKKVLWTEAYEDELRVGGMIDLQKDVAQKVATIIGQPHGLVFRADSSLSVQPPPDDLEAYSCTLAFFSYRAELEPQQHAEVRSCLESTVTRFPRYATAWALLSLTYLDEDRFEYNPVADASPAVVRALDAAQRAAALDPDNIRALQALMLAYFFSQDVASGLAAGERARALNPNDMELLGEFGVRTALSGNWAEGSAMIEQALVYTKSNANYYYSVLALSAYMQRDFGRAVDLIGKASVESNGLYCLIAAVIYGQSGMQAEARAATEAYFATKTRYLDNLDAEFAKRNIRPADRVLFVDGLRKAGLPVPADALAGAGTL